MNEVSIYCCLLFPRRMDTSLVQQTSLMQHTKSSKSHPRISLVLAKRAAAAGTVWTSFPYQQLVHPASSSDTILAPLLAIAHRTMQTNVFVCRCGLFYLAWKKECSWGFVVGELWVAACCCRLLRGRPQAAHAQQQRSPPPAPLLPRHQLTTPTHPARNCCSIRKLLGMWECGQS